MDTVMTSHCPGCGLEVNAADFHYLPKKEGIVTTYECRGCGEEKTVEAWLKMFLEMQRGETVPKA